MQALAQLNESPFYDLQFWIKIIFIESISGVVLKLVKMKKQEKKCGYNFDTNIHHTISQVSFLQTFLYLLNRTSDWCNIFLEAN